ncbi:recombinase family protein [Dactylosporangium sp. NPDC005572]|uniref:recombinase family protein n=1 Tax=Dactylosporangium sp. NPDC005572 TaxID=3156889 RepID=UPI0033BFA4F0
MRTVLYGRQSKGDESSVEDQITEQTTDVTEQGWQIVAILSDLVSASRFGKKQRDDWLQLLDLVRNGAVDVVCFWESSRGSRELEDWVVFLKLCRTKGVKLRITKDKETIDLGSAKAFRDMASDGLHNAYESDIRSDNTKRGVRMKAAAGRPPGKLVFGYERSRKGKEITQWINEPEAVIVRRIFKEFSEGKSLRSIALELHKEKIGTKGGAAWSHTTLRRMLLNPTYLGERWFQGKFVAKGIWPPIIDRATFVTVAAILADPNRKVNHDGSFKYWLSGVAQCDECSSLLRVGRTRGVTHYRCFGSGYCVSIRADDLEAYVADQVKERMLSVRTVEKDEIGIRVPILEDETVKTLESRLLDVKQAIVDGTYSIAFGGEVAADIERKLTEAKERASAKLVKKTVTLLRWSGAEFDDMTPEQKRKVAESYVTVRVRKVGKTGSIRIAAEDRVTVADVELTEFI